ncbi:MAG: hypothetical protein M3220_01680, partial [Chloroflexota bacterium]|nr:hypothetical protein [Chloroflexota bacterium]
LEGVDSQIEQGVPEPPQVPYKGIFVKRPRVATRYVGSDMGRQWPPKQEREYKIKASDHKMAASNT